MENYVYTIFHIFLILYLLQLTHYPYKWTTEVDRVDVYVCVSKMEKRGWNSNGNISSNQKLEDTDLFIHRTLAKYSQKNIAQIFGWWFQHEFCR